MNDVLDDDAVEKAMRELPGWERKGASISKDFAHDDFRSAILFVSRVADAAEAIGGQHLDIHVHEGEVALTIGSRATGALTEDDFHLAHRVQRLVGDHRHPSGPAGP